MQGDGHHPDVRRPCRRANHVGNLHLPVPHARVLYRGWLFLRQKIPRRAVDLLQEALQRSVCTLCQVEPVLPRFPQPVFQDWADERAIRQLGWRRDPPLRLVPILAADGPHHLLDGWLRRVPSGGLLVLQGIVCGRHRLPHPLPAALQPQQVAQPRHRPH